MGTTYPTTRTTTVVSVALRRSEMFQDDAGIARSLWDQGFRPTPAQDVHVGDTVAFFATLLGVALNEPARYSVVESVTVNDREHTVTITHGGAETEADEDGEVWTREMALPYPWCIGASTKDACRSAGSCRRNPNCGD